MFFQKNKELFLQNNTILVTMQDIHFPYHRLTMTEKNLIYTCIKFFNKLTSDIKNIEHFMAIRRKITELLLDLELYCLDDYLQRTI